MLQPRSAAYVCQVAHKQHKGDMEREEEREHNNDSYEQTQASKVDLKKDKHEMSMLLKSVKMKIKTTPVIAFF
ncbi:unnamed protein product [Lactuca virosa]|uniref:Uncharacterized protein n=1 Tax=Lactuca virosa TaxID=75947 RepID=A0AAU9M591_9ASTR|nr:unnamed protein product [Lactuca virosa]